MTFQWLAFPPRFMLDFSLALPGVVATLVFAGVSLFLIIRYRADFAAFRNKQWGLFLVLLLMTPLFAQALVIDIQFPGIITHFQAALVGLIPLCLAALWLGAAPAGIIGLITGLMWALSGTGRVTQPFEVAILGTVLAALLRQSYRGTLSQWLRQPLVATLLVATFVGWPVAITAAFLTDNAPVLENLDRTLTLVLPTLFAYIVCAVGSSLLIQAVLWQWPAWHPAQRLPKVIPPWERQFSRRVLYMLAPLSIIVVISLVGVVSFASYQVATRVVIDQIARDAANAGSGIPFFVQVGRSLIQNISQDERLFSDENESRQDALSENLRAVPFFHELILIDPSQTSPTIYPESNPSALVFSTEEDSRLRLAAEEGIPAEVTRIGENGETVMSFIAPVVDPDTGRTLGVLIGRTGLQSNPTLIPVIDLLQGGFAGSGEGLIIDTQNRILLYPAHPELVQEMFAFESAVQVPTAPVSGQAFRRVEADGTRQIIYVQSVAGRSDWSVVYIVPNEVALDLASQIALPMLILLVVMASIAIPLTVVVVRQVTIPLEKLLQAVERITEGQLDLPMHVSGDDEVGRLGQAFEAMRVRLKTRLSEQELLLRVSRSVASTLELFRSMPPILSSALDITQARGVRIALQQLSGSGPLQTYAAGEAAAMGVLDSQLLKLVEQQGTVVIGQVARTGGSLDFTGLPAIIQSLVALPLRSDSSFHGIMWLGFDHEHVFEEAELNFLTTLAGQAALAAANANLLAEAEEGRRKLEAILQSTPDGLIVADNQGKIILMNPAAEKYFQIRSDKARNRPAKDVIDMPELAALLTDLKEPVASLEIPDREGKTLLANISTIQGNKGVLTGRVAVLRDVTPLKELDNIKTVFLRMVSHDLRSPLTYMRGYLSMLPLSGDLNERQHESLEKINNGIKHISEMTERLLYLSRLQFGDHAELEFALMDVEEIVNAIRQEHVGLAKDKDITVRIDVMEKLPLVLADVMLYQQAVSNLLTNALKYTSEGGEVVIRAFMDAGNQITITVSDNGMGIRSDDIPRLFTAFFRVPQREGEPSRPRGTGLGLALVKAIAEAHGGTVGVESKFGKGSKFRITIPIRDIKEIMPQPASSSIEN